MKIVPRAVKPGQSSKTLLKVLERHLSARYFRAPDFGSVSMTVVYHDEKIGRVDISTSVTSFLAEDELVPMVIKPSQTRDALLKALEKHLLARFFRAPNFGSINITLIYEDGEIRRVDITNSFSSLHTTEEEAENHAG